MTKTVTVVDAMSGGQEDYLLPAEEAIISAAILRAGEGVHLACPRWRNAYRRRISKRGDRLTLDSLSVRIQGEST